VWSAWSRFVGTFGWRAYAVVVLAILTVIVVVRPGAAAGSDATSAPPPAAHGPAPAAPVVRPSTSANSAASSAPAATTVSPLSAPTVIPDKVDSTPCQSNSSGQLVLVSVSTQKAWMCQGQQQVNSTPVTTGNVKAGTATPLGTWQVQAKQTNRYLTGPGYSDFVKFWVPFNGDFGFHDASWQSFAFGSPLYQTAGSNGCVHLPTPAMTWFYSWVQDGTKVTVTA
jgi:lipoprotein-anchoring transpeptidase ErfK/SrfK